MEKTSFVINGGTKLPIGYRFHPTDEELVVHYLRRKACGAPLPASIIPEFDVFQTEPWCLPGDLKEKRYFFRKKRRNENDRTSKIAAGSGYWRPLGKSKQIIASISNQTVGMRKTLVYYEIEHSNKIRTQWVMHEYRLVGSGTIPNMNQIYEIKQGEWVVHRIFQRKRRTKRRGTIICNPSMTKRTQTFEVISPSFMDFNAEESSDVSPPQPSSPCLSEITDEVSSNGLDQEEISSIISFSGFNSCMKKT